MLGSCLSRLTRLQFDVHGRALVSFAEGLLEDVGMITLFRDRDHLPSRREICECETALLIAESRAVEWSETNLRAGYGVSVGEIAHRARKLSGEGREGEEEEKDEVQPEATEYEEGMTEEEYYQSLEDMYEEGDRAATTFSLLIRQKDLVLNTEGKNQFRIVKNRFAIAYVHTIPLNGGYPKFICAGDHSVLNNPHVQHPLDPENCPVCRYILEKKMDTGFPAPNYYWPVIDRTFQKECAKKDQDTVLQVLQISAKQFRQLKAVGNDPDERPMIDIGNDKLVPDFTKYDIIVEKVKTGKEKKDVEYTIKGSTKINSLTDEEEALVASLPKDFVTSFTRPADRDKIEETLYKKNKKDDDEFESGGGRQSRVSRKKPEGDDPDF